MEEKTSVKRPRRKLLVVIGAILAVAVISGGGYLLYKNKISADTSSAPYSQSLCNLYLENDIQLPANNLRKGIYVFGASTTMTTLSDSDLIAAMDGGSTTVRDITDNTYLDNLVRYTTVVPSTGRNNIFIAYSGDNTKIIRSNAFTCQAGDKIYVNASLYNTGYINYSKISVAADMNSANPTSICLQKDSAYTLFSRDQSTTTGSPLYHSSDGSINGTETDLIGIGYSNTNDLTKCGATAAAATASGAISGTSTIANAPTAASVIAAAANGTGLPSQICIKKADGLFTLLNKGSSSDSYQSTDGTMQGKYEDFYTNPGLADLSSCGITKVTPVATGNSAGSPSTTSTTKTLANGTQITVIQQMCFDKPSTGEPVAMYKAKDGYNYDNAGNKYSDAELMQNGFTNSVALDKCGLTEAAVNDTTKNNLPATAAPATKALNIVSNKTTDFPYGTGEITFQPVRFSFGGSTTMDSWAPVGGVNFTVTIYPDSKKTSFLDIFNNVMAEKAYAAQADSKNTQTNTTALTNKNTNSVMAAAVQLPYDSNVLKPGDKTFAQKTTDVFKNMFSSQNSYQVSGIVPENGSNSSFTLTKMPAGTYEIVLNRSNFNSSQW